MVGRKGLISEETASLHNASLVYKVKNFRGQETVEIEKVSVSRIKKFQEMTGLSKLGETLKMFYFMDRVADNYRYDMGLYLNYKKQVRERNLASAKAYSAWLRESLIEQQRLIAKYNCEDLIVGLEIIDPNSKEYTELIEPYKVNSNDWSSRLFQHVFKPLYK